jgi:hypothetical protein
MAYRLREIVVDCIPTEAVLREEEEDQEGYYE